MLGILVSGGHVPGAKGIFRGLEALLSLGVPCGVRECGMRLHLGWDLPYIGVVKVLLG